MTIPFPLSGLQKTKLEFCRRCLYAKFSSFDMVENICLFTVRDNFYHTRLSLGLHSAFTQVATQPHRLSFLTNKSGNAQSDWEGTLP